MTYNESVNHSARMGRRGAAVLQIIAMTVGFALGVGAACLIVVGNSAAPLAEEGRTEAVGSDSIASVRRQLDEPFSDN